MGTTPSPVPSRWPPCSPWGRYPGGGLGAGTLTANDHTVRSQLGLATASAAADHCCDRSSRLAPTALSSPRLATLYSRDQTRCRCSRLSTLRRSRQVDWKRKHDG